MSDPSLLNTTQLLERFRAGQDSARDALLERYLPVLTRWAHGRLPGYCRDLAETDDLVQVTLLRALNNLESFAAERPGAFLAYLRTILLNLVRDELRRYAARPVLQSLGDTLGNTLASPQPSVVEQVVGQQRLEDYERALAKLPELKRNAVMMRVEFGMTYEEIARELERPSANAARMTVARALDDLAAEMSPEMKQ